jgi:hypothetical protein
MKFRLLWAVLAFWSGGLQAQPAVAPAASALPVTPPQAAAPCELYIFPTNEIIDASPQYGSDMDAYGLIGFAVGAVLTEAQQAGSGKLLGRALDQMRSYLAPEAQIGALEQAGVLQTLKLPPDTRITNGGVLPAMWGEAPAEPVQRQAYKDMWAAMKKGRAIREAQSTCHSELIIASISVSKGLGSLKFSSSFVYRVWDGKGGGSAAIRRR